MKLMFSACRGLQTGLLLLALGACSKEPTLQPSTPTPALTQPSERPANAPTLSGHINAAGIEATYDATFAADEHLRISELRADSRKGEYQLRGARLLHYRGGALTSTDDIELRFSLQGVLELAKARSGGTVSQEEIRAVRERVQLLRSHALAQKTTHDHY